MDGLSDMAARPEQLATQAGQRFADPLERCDAQRRLSGQSLRHVCLQTKGQPHKWKVNLAVCSTGELGTVSGRWVIYIKLHTLRVLS